MKKTYKLSIALLAVCAAMSPIANAQWNSASSTTTQTLHYVKFISTTKGWAVGENATTLYSSNGGASWIARPTGLSNAKLYWVDFVNENEGWVAGEFGVIMKTSNGGSNWSPQGTPATSIFRLSICSMRTRDMQ